MNIPPKFVTWMKETYGDGKGPWHESKRSAISGAIPSGEGPHLDAGSV